MAITTSKATLVDLVYGRDLSPTDLSTINERRKAEFGSRFMINPKPNNREWNKPYFLAREGSKLLAFGRLDRIQVEFRDATHEILGIASIVAMEKGQGYGTALMRRMKECIEASGLTAIGFCRQDVAAFYPKCGYSLLMAGQRRFAFTVDGTLTPSTHPDDHVLYLEGRDKLVTQMREHPGDLVTAFRPIW